MAEQFLHGVEVVEIDTGTRPIRTVRSSVIGLVGTAPNANADKFPINTPVLIAGKRSDAAGLGDAGTLMPAIDDIFDQAGAIVVVVRVEEGADDAATLSNVIGGTDAVTGLPEGLQVLLAAESTLGVAPRILVVPEFSQEQAVVSELTAIATRLRAVIIADGPNSNDADAIAYRDNFEIRCRARLLAFSVQPADRRHPGHCPARRFHAGRCERAGQHPERKGGHHDHPA